jgi:3-methyladenine DNA glycosylase AlkC
MTPISNIAIAIVAVASAAVVMIAQAHEDHSHATGIVKQRMETMTRMRDRIKAMARLVKAKQSLVTIAGDA